MTEHEADGATARTLAEKLKHLNDTVGPYTLEESVAGIKACGGAVSRANLNALHLGRRSNPSKSTLEDIARFYGVSVAYLLDDPHPQVTPEEHELLLIIRHAGVQDLVRAVGQLRPETRQALGRVIADLRAMHSAEQPDHRT